MLDFSPCTGSPLANTLGHELEGASDPSQMVIHRLIPCPAQLEKQLPSYTPDAPASLNQGLNFFYVSLYLHVSLFFGIVKLGITTFAGGPRESGQHAKVYFPAIHKAAFRIKLSCKSKEEAAKLIRRYETLAFHILSVFVLCGEVCYTNCNSSPLLIRCI